MSPTIAITIALFGAYLAHFLTSRRFKNELIIKRSEKKFDDAKQLTNDFEKKLQARIHFTRDYLYRLKKSKKEETEIDIEFRKEYRTLIKDWNLSFDYASSKIQRENILKNSDKKLNSIQKELSLIHGFIAINADKPSEASYNSIESRIKKLATLQTEAYRTISEINTAIDDKWLLILNNKSSLSKATDFIFAYVITTLTIYVTVCFLLFLSGLRPSL